MGEIEGQGLKLANQNPWYVLMTLYGEQDGEEIDWELHERNRRAWNAWAGQALSPEAQEEAAQSSKIDVSELRAWETLRTEIQTRFEAEWGQHNGKEAGLPALPDPKFVINLSKTCFSKKSVFEKMVFVSAVRCESAVFSAKTSYKHATFISDAYFTHSRFRAYTSFDYSTFRAKSLFGKCTFCADAKYFSVTFTGEASFRSTEFSATALFARAAYLGRSYFARAQFGNEQDGTASIPDFTDCQFDQPSTFRDAKFRNAYPIFEGAMLHPTTVFTAEEAHWPKGTTQDAKQVRDSCAALRHVMTQQGLPEDAHFFFRREMAGAEQIGNLWQRLPYHLFRIFSEYGYSIARPTLWLLGCWALGVALFWGICRALTEVDRGWRWG